MELRVGVVGVPSRVGVQVGRVLVDLPQAFVLAGLAVPAKGELPGPGVGQKIGPGIEHAPCFEQDHVEAEVDQYPGSDAAAGSRAHNCDVVLRHESSLEEDLPMITCVRRCRGFPSRGRPPSRQ